MCGTPQTAFCARLFLFAARARARTHTHTHRRWASQGARHHPRRPSVPGAGVPGRPAWRSARSRHARPERGTTSRFWLRRTCRGVVGRAESGCTFFRQERFVENIVARERGRSDVGGGGGCAFDRRPMHVWRHATHWCTNNVDLCRVPPNATRETRAQAAVNLPRWHRKVGCPGPGALGTGCHRGTGGRESEKERERKRKRKRAREGGSFAWPYLWEALRDAVERGEHPDPARRSTLHAARNGEHAVNLGAPV